MTRVHLRVYSFSIGKTSYYNLKVSIVCEKVKFERRGREGNEEEAILNRQLTLFIVAVYAADGGSIGKTLYSRADSSISYAGYGCCVRLYILHSVGLLSQVIT